MLGGGYERKFNDQQTLIDHMWTYLPQQKENHLLKPGQYSYEFELILPGKLPESTHVAKYYLVQYQLRAVAERPGFLVPNYTIVKNIHLSRQKSCIISDYLEPIVVESRWASKLDYEISIPTRVFTFGDTIPITIQVFPLAPHLHIRYLCCTFKEYMTCRAINGWFNGKNKTHGRIIKYIRKDQHTLVDKGIVRDATVWTTELKIQVPESMTDIQCDAKNESVKVRHQLKLVMSIENEDGHISELRAALPVVIAITNTIVGLPAYEETSRTLPYDPVLMLTLIRQQSNNDNIRLPSYNSLYPQ